MSDFCVVFTVILSAQQQHYLKHQQVRTISLGEYMHYSACELIHNSEGKVVIRIKLPIFLITSVYIERYFFLLTKSLKVYMDSSNTTVIIIFVRAEKHGITETLSRI